MTVSNIKPEPFDIDHDRDGLSLRHDADGRLTARDGARVWTSVDQGRTWKAVETDCDGLLAEPPIVLDGIDLSAVGTQAGRGQRSRAVPFTDTPGPDGTGERSGIMIEVPAEGWPDRWNESLSGDYRTTMIGRIICTVPNTEPGRRAAWAMEGE